MPPGALLATFFGFSRHDFPRNFGYVSGDLFTLPGRFWTPSGIVFETFRWCSALAETVPPLSRELRFRCFKRSEIRFFPTTLSRGTGGRYFRLFGVLWAPLGHPSALLWAPGGAYSGKEMSTHFGWQNDAFVGSAPAQGNRSGKRSWPCARKKSITLWYRGSSIMIFGLLIYRSAELLIS